MQYARAQAKLPAPWALPSAIQLGQKQQLKQPLHTVGGTMRCRTILAVLSAALVLFCTAPVGAQMKAQKPAVYTYVAQWSIPRAQWSDMAKMQQSNTALLDKLVADGTLVSYGAYEAAVHDRK